MDMSLKPTQALTLESLRRLLDPGRVFYRPAVDDAVHRGDLAEINALLQGAREAKAQWGDLDGLIKHLETAAKRAQ